MSPEEQARQLMAQERMHSEHVHDAMLNRSMQSLETHLEGETEEKARELMAQGRLHDEHLQETMRNRSAQEVGATNIPENNS